MSVLGVDALARYSSHHRRLANRWLHAVGVPVITLSLLLALATVPLFTAGGFAVTAAEAVALVVMAYWVLLDAPIGLVSAVLHVGLVAAARALASSTENIWALFALLFFGGWVFQLVGHKLEGRRPALLENLGQIFIAPFFLVTEAMFALGLRSGVRDTVESRWRTYV